ncbi:hypothetical protein ANCDUO_08548 [Ancylostoma duodenale]|uniref:7TM GPCR serpentine receptor class x (Srx) domain-containing protein n=1 Tax=Ancylostoma duodenale TaxID=51022 RepID=A0A0C2GVP3_9BILA|nr:hypothetical protein ANCDUO_08548 [Ancylostoma duodenale]
MTLNVTVVINICIAARIVIMRLTRTFVSFSMKKNVVLFWQGFFQEIFFVNDTIFQRFLGDLIDSPLWWFLSFTFMWEIAHTCDG